MKNWFASLTLARWIILVSIVASLGLGYYGFRLHAQRTTLEAFLDKDARLLALDLRNLARQYTVLVRQASREGIGDIANPSTYIRQIATSKDVQIGDTTIDPPAEAENIKGVLDTRYGIKPSSRERGFGRLNIANFLFKLESENRRIRVTKLRLEPEAKSVKPENILETDAWKWEAEVTTRAKIEAPPTKPK